MIYIACALYDEAVPWIKALKLKKNTAASKFQIFESEAAYLAVTGTGMMNAAVALTYLCTLHMPGKHDIFVNTGVCGAAKECGAPGSLYLIHKITGASSGRSYYPDILYGHPFSEGAVTSFFAVQEQIPDGQLPGKILEQADRLLLHFKATQAMRGQLFSHLYYCCLCGRDVSGLLEAVTSEPCRSKKDGMARFRALLKDLKTGV